MRGRFTDHAPLLRTGQRRTGVLVVPGFDVLVRVFNHHHGRIHHCTDRNCDPAKRHDVGVDALVVHDDERHEHSEG